MKLKITMTQALFEILMENVTDSPVPSFEIGNNYEVTILPATESSNEVIENSASNDEAATDGDVDVVGGGTKPPRP